MKEKKILKKLNNFIVYEYSEDGMDYVGISTVNGDWSIEYRMDSSMYLSLRMLLDTESPLLEFCTIVFITTYTLHGSEVYRSIRDSIVKELESVGKPRVTKEEDEKLLGDAIDMDDLGEMIKSDEDGTIRNQ